MYIHYFAPDESLNQAYFVFQEYECRFAEGCWRIPNAHGDWSTED